MLIVLFFAVIGLLIGSFANVVIYRVPAKRSVVFPRSSCPNCGRILTPFDLVPVFSWLFLRARCRSCGQGISARYPIIEALMGLGFAALVLRFPLEIYGFTVLPLLVLFTMFVMMSMIDIDHYLLPDSLTLPAIVVGLVGTFLYSPFALNLPTFREALFAGALGAGILALVNRIGSLVLRRLGDTKERLWPIGMDQLNVAALGGALGGWLWGLAAAGVSLLLNLVTRKTLRLPEGILYALWFMALFLSASLITVDVITAISGSLVAAGAVAIAGAVYWWLYDMSRESEEVMEDDDEPIAMGFGDVKLAGVLGVMLGWQNLLVALMLSFIIGAIGGIIGRMAGGSRQVPFGPYLAIGGLLALFIGADIINWYLGTLGL